MSTTRTLADLRDAVIADMSDKYDLIYVDRGDRLSDEQVGYLLAGDMESLWDDIGEWESDARWEGVKYHLEDMADDVLRRWEREDDDFDGTDLRDSWFYSEEWEEARYELEERDSGDWFRDLVNGCGSVFVRIRVGEPVMLDGNTLEDDEVLADLVDNLCIPGVPADLVRDIARECCVCCEHTPFIFGSVQVRDIYDLPAEGEVTVKGGSLVLEQVWAGAGYSEALPDDFEVTVAREAIRSDADQFGYAWDDVCGFVPGAYPIELVAVVAEEVAA